MYEYKIKLAVTISKDYKVHAINDTMALEQLLNDIKKGLTKDEKLVSYYCENIKKEENDGF